MSRGVGLPLLPLYALIAWTGKTLPQLISTLILPSRLLVGTALGSSYIKTKWSTAVLLGCRSSYIKTKWSTAVLLGYRSHI